MKKTFAMKINLLQLVSASWILASVALGEVSIKTEQIRPAEPAWKFKTIPGPSKSDAANGAKVTFVDNAADPQSGDPLVLTDGELPRSGGATPGFAFFSNGNAAPGKMLMDFGRVVQVAAVNSYPWHEFAPEQGPRQTQVWAVLRRADSDQRLIYSLAATFLDRMCLSGEIAGLTDAQWRLVLRAQQLYRRAAPVIKEGAPQHFGARGKLASSARLAGCAARLMRSSRDAGRRACVCGSAKGGCRSCSARRVGNHRPAWPRSGGGQWSTVAVCH